MAALQSFANAGGANHMQMGEFNDEDSQDDSDDGEVFEFNPPFEDAEKIWQTNDQFERWIIIEGVSKAP